MSAPAGNEAGPPPETDYGRARAAINTIDATVSKLVRLALDGIDKDDNVEQQSVELTAAFHAATMTIRSFMEDEGSGAREEGALTRAERLRASIEEVKGLIEEAEAKLASWEGQLLDTYEEAEGVQSEC